MYSKSLSPRCCLWRHFSLCFPVRQALALLFKENASVSPILYNSSKQDSTSWVLDYGGQSDRNRPCSIFAGDYIDSVTISV